MFFTTIYLLSIAVDLANAAVEELKSKCRNKRDKLAFKNNLINFKEDESNC